MKILNGFYDKAGFVGDWKVECFMPKEASVLLQH